MVSTGVVSQKRPGYFAGAFCGGTVMPGSINHLRKVKQDLDHIIETLEDYLRDSAAHDEADDLWRWFRQKRKEIETLIARRNLSA